MKRYDVDDNLNRLLEQGKVEGQLSVTTITQYDILPEQLDEFLEQCSEAGIEIIDNQLDTPENDDFTDKDYYSADNDYYFDEVKAYLTEIGKIPLLSADEEILIAKTIKEGSPEDASKAKKKLVESNLRLVFSIAKKYSSIFNEPILDVVQDGNLGLMKAVEKFDYTKGFKFSTYATPWIKQYIRRAHYDTGRSIRLPCHMNELINKVKREIALTMAQTGTLPTTQEIAKNLNLPVDTVSQAILHSQTISSLDEPVGDEESNSFLIDFIQDESEAFSDSLVMEITVSEILEKAADYLTPRELEIVKKRYGFFDGKKYTLEEIANINGVTRERIRQIEAKAIKKLRNHINPKQYR